MIPGLIKKRLSKMKRPPRRAIPTRAGLFALGTPILLGVAAINASNNLLFILLGAILGSIVVSGILSERNMKGVRVSARLLSPAYAEEPARLIVAFERAQEHAGSPAFALRVREMSGEGMLAYFRNMKGGLETHLPVLEGRRAEKVSTRVFQKRGKAEVDHCELTTRYPFGLLIKARDADVDVDVLVRPKRIEVPPRLDDPRGLDAEGDTSEKRGHGLDVYGLRERDDRDSIQRVHALRSMTLGKDVVIETTGVERPHATLGIASFSSADPIAFERALEVAQATLLRWEERGFAVGLVTASWELAPGELELESVLDRLAALQPADGKTMTRKLHPSLWIVPAGASAPGEARAIANVGADGTVEVR